MASEQTQRSSQASSERSSVSLQPSEAMSESTQALEIPSEVEVGFRHLVISKSTQIPDVAPEVDSTQTTAFSRETKMRTPRTSALTLGTESRSTQTSEVVLEDEAETTQVTDVSSKSSAMEEHTHVHGPECRQSSPFSGFPTWHCVNTNTSLHPKDWSKHPPSPAQHYSFVPWKNDVAPAERSGQAAEDRTKDVKFEASDEEPSADSQP